MRLFCSPSFSFSRFAALPLKPPSRLSHIMRQSNKAMVYSELRNTMLSYDFSARDKAYRWSDLIQLADKERLLETQFLKEVFQLTVNHCNEL